MNKKMILFSGVHGVGKGYFLSKNIPEEGEFSVVEASELISRYKEAEDAGYKKVKDISENQLFLLKALEEERCRIKNNIILDGHLCMINVSGGIECIPEKFIEKALISGIILLQDEAEAVASRLKKRDGFELSVDLIETIQHKEKEYCDFLKKKYNISYAIINNTYNYQQLYEIIRNM